MNRINTAVEKARYQEIKAILIERGTWCPANYAVTFEAINTSEGYRGDVVLIDAPNQLHDNFYRERPHLNPETARIYRLNHSAGLAQG